MKSDKNSCFLEVMQNFADVYLLLQEGKLSLKYSVNKAEKREHLVMTQNLKCYILKQHMH